MPRSARAGRSGSNWSSRKAAASTSVISTVGLPCVRARMSSRAQSFCIARATPSDRSTGGRAAWGGACSSASSRLARIVAIGVRSSCAASPTKRRSRAIRVFRSASRPLMDPTSGRNSVGRDPGSTGRERSPSASWSSCRRTGVRPRRLWPRSRKPSGTPSPSDTAAVPSTIQPTRSSSSSTGSVRSTARTNSRGRAAPAGSLSSSRTSKPAVALRAVVPSSRLRSSRTGPEASGAAGGVAGAGDGPSTSCPLWKSTRPAASKNSKNVPPSCSGSELRTPRRSIWSVSKSIAPASNSASCSYAIILWMRLWSNSSVSAERIACSSQVEALMATATLPRMRPPRRRTRRERKRLTRRLPARTRGPRRGSPAHGGCGSRLRGRPPASRACGAGRSRTRRSRCSGPRRRSRRGSPRAASA